MILMNGMYFNTLQDMIKYKMYDNYVNGRLEQFGWKEL